MRMRALSLVALGALLVAGAAAGWWRWSHPGLPDGIAVANGRVESEQVQIATKFAGRVDTVLVEEGDGVAAGAVVARMDARDFEAQLRQAKAEVVSAERRQDEAAAVIAERAAARKLAVRELARARSLHEKGYASAQALDRARAEIDQAEAGYEAAQASLHQAIASVDAARAAVARIEISLEDCILTAPRSGRIQYKLIQPGEVVAAGTPIVTLLDLSDVYMTIFLPAREAGALALGDEARVVFDPVPQYVVPAKITFVAADAQFTPKSVETREEREKLMFRVKLTFAPDLLKLHAPHVKTGVRGVAYLRTSLSAVWPETLAVKLPSMPSADRADERS